MPLYRAASLALMILATGVGLFANEQEDLSFA